MEGNSRKAFSLDNIYLVLAIAAALVVLALYLRSGLLGYQGMFEPDGFFYYTALKAAIAQGGFLHGGMVPLSGYPVYNTFNEAPGLLYIALIPYAIVQFFGVSAYNVIRLMAPIFGVLEMVLAYFIAKYLSKSRALGLIAMFFVAASSGDIARTAATVFRGDSFITLFLMIALIFIIMMVNELDKRKKYVWLVGATFFMSVGNIIWNGGAIITGVTFLSVFLLVIYAFIAADRRLMDDSLLLLGGVFAAFLLSVVYIAAGIANPGVISNATFFIMFVPVFLGAVICKFLIEKGPMSEGGAHAHIGERAAVAAAACLVIGAIVAAFFWAQISTVLQNGGILGAGNIGSTTQELQRPTWDFIWASFGLQIILAPLGILLFILFSHSHGNKKSMKKGRFTFNINYAFIVLFAYLVFTADLQYNAIRYNAMLAIPVAILAAYALYAIGKIIEPYSLNMGGTQLKLRDMYLVLVLVLLLYQAILVQQEAFGSVQADGINPQFLQAMTWLSNNTASNAKVLTLWPDGSVVEGWGNRTSFIDSVGGENATRIYDFASQFLFNTTPSANYLYNTAHKPNYIVVRNFWFAELQGIAIEGNITNLTNYGLTPLGSFSTGGNLTNQQYFFSSGQYEIELVLAANSALNGSRSVSAFIGVPSSGQSTPIAHVIFVNSTTGNFTWINTNQNGALNYTLLLTYRGNSITSALLLGPILPYTNLFKLIMLCGPLQCAYQSNSIVMTPVYENSDTKIIKVTYLQNNFTPG